MQVPLPCFTLDLSVRLHLSASICFSLLPLPRLLISQTVCVCKSLCVRAYETLLTYGFWFRWLSEETVSFLLTLFSFTPSLSQRREDLLLVLLFLLRPPQSSSLLSSSSHPPSPTPSLQPVHPWPLHLELINSIV